jgi:hypothetical protein
VIPLPASTLSVLTPKSLHTSSVRERGNRSSEQGSTCPINRRGRLEPDSRHTPSPEGPSATSIPALLDLSSRKTVGTSGSSPPPLEIRTVGLSDRRHLQSEDLQRLESSTPVNPDLSVLRIETVNTSSLLCPGIWSSQTSTLRPLVSSPSQTFDIADRKIRDTSNPRSIRHRGPKPSAREPLSGSDAAFRQIISISNSELSMRESEEPQHLQPRPLDTSDPLVVGIRSRNLRRHRPESRCRFELRTSDINDPKAIDILEPDRTFDTASPRRGRWYQSSTPPAPNGHRFHPSMRPAPEIRRPPDTDSSNSFDATHPEHADISNPEGLATPSPQRAIGVSNPAGPRPPQIPKDPQRLEPKDLRPRTPRRAGSLKSGRTIDTTSFKELWTQLRADSLHPEGRIETASRAQLPPATGEPATFASLTRPVRGTPRWRDFRTSIPKDLRPSPSLACGPSSANSLLNPPQTVGSSENLPTASLLEAGSGARCKYVS